MQFNIIQGRFLFHEEWVCLGLSFYHFLLIGCDFLEFSGCDEAFQMQYAIFFQMEHKDINSINHGI